MNRVLTERTILITGGAGFIGSNFVPHFLEHNPGYTVINVDKLTYAGNLDNLKEIDELSRHIFVEGDICDKNLVDLIFKEYQPDGVIHFAAESHVDNSIIKPDSFIKTNIEGTFILLEAAKKYWNGNLKRKRFHHISTDEVYGSLGADGFFKETSSYAPNSPYSASKAASDFLVRSYYHTYGLNVVTSNCSNNYGPKQHDEKLIPTIIRTALKGLPIPIYGSGSNIRDWLYVLDHCEGINQIFHKGIAGQTYLLGGGNEFANLQVAKTICETLDEIRPKSSGSYQEQITFVEDRKGHDFRYAIDASKTNKEIGWKPKENFSSGLKKTINWYLNKYTL